MAEEKAELIGDNDGFRLPVDPSERTVREVMHAEAVMTEHIRFIHQILQQERATISEVVAWRDECKERRPLAADRL